MRSLLVFGLLVSALALSGCCIKRSSCCSPCASPCAATASSAGTVSRAHPTEVTYVSKPAPATRSAAVHTPPAPPIPGAAAAATPCDPCAPCPPCNPCKPVCNPLKKIFCIGGS